VSQWRFCVLYAFQHAEPTKTHALISSAFEYRYSNQFSGTFPTDFGLAAFTLCISDASSKALTGTLPASLGALQVLE